MHKQKQKNFFVLLLLFLLSPFLVILSARVQATASHIVISEVQIAGSATTDDFIELYNPTNVPISLDGYRLVKRTAGGSSDTTIKSFSSSDTIPAYGYFLWANSSFTGIASLPDAATAQTLASDNGVAIRQGAEDTGTVIDSVAWGSATNIFIEGAVFPTNPIASQSIERKQGEISVSNGNGEDTDNNAGDFQIRATSEPQNSSSPAEMPPGAVPLAPPAPAPQVSDLVVINEILPAPGTTTDWDADGAADVNDEWVEIYNGDTVDVDLGSWVLDDLEGGGSSAYTIPAGTAVVAGGYLVLYKKDTGLVLNNTGDSVVLKKPDGTVRDSHNYTASPGTDQVIARNPDAAGSFVVAPYAPTKGTKNIGPNQNPTVDAGPDSLVGTVGQQMSFTATALDPDGGSIVSYTWDFGDGGIGSGNSIQHAFSQIGSFTVKITVTDDRGGTGEDTIQVAIGTPGGGNTQANQTNSAAQSTPVVSAQNLSNQIKLSAVVPNPAGLDTTDEYIEVINLGTAPVNLKDWSLSDSAAKPFVIKSDLNILPSSKIKFYSEETKLSLNNSGDTVILYDSAKQKMDEVVYASAAEGAAYVFQNGKWGWVSGAHSQASNVKSPTTSLPVSNMSNASSQTSVTGRTNAGSAAGNTTTRDQAIALPLAPVDEMAAISAYVPKISMMGIGGGIGVDSSDGSRSALTKNTPMKENDSSTQEILEPAPLARPLSTDPAVVVPMIFFLTMVVAQKILGVQIVGKVSSVIAGFFSSSPVGSAQETKQAIEDLFLKK